MLNCGVVPSTLVILPRGSSALIPIGIYLGKRKIREGLAEKTGSTRETVRMRILRGFLKSDEFGLGECQPLRL
jgi:hypothetical protein